MGPVIQAIQLFATAFVTSLAIGAGVSHFRLRRRRHVLDTVRPETIVRLRSLSGMYRARFLTKDRAGIHISSPMQRDFFVPLRVGEEVSIEVPIDKGVVVFKSEVVSRDTGNHTFCLRAPAVPALINRREEARTERFHGEQAFINEEPAELVDVSRSGARLLSFCRHEPGDVVRVAIPRFDASQLAHVMDCTPAPLQDRQGFQLRLRFIDPLPPIPVKLRS
ncbi:MAG: flagellar brake protein [Chthonomonas sp.]|nr:flagellar brake protein [Chthonomonas sp.]